MKTFCSIVFYDGEALAVSATQNRKPSRSMVAYTLLPGQRFAGALTAHHSGPTWIATPSSQGTSLTPCRSALRTVFRIALDERTLREARVVGSGRRLVLFRRRAQPADQI
jgi:hypothetical protein